MTADVPLLLVDGHNLLFRACFGTPAQIMSHDQDDKRELAGIGETVLLSPGDRGRPRAHRLLTEQCRWCHREDFAPPGAGYQPGPGDEPHPVRRLVTRSADVAA